MGGKGVYQFLYLVNTPRVSALAGSNISLPVDDPALAYYNPALLSDSMNKHFTLNYVNYFGDINYGYTGYAMKLREKEVISLGIHHINYGKFKKADEAGVISGTFYASEYALNLIYSRKIDSMFRWGVNLKPVLSVFEHYRSYGCVADAGIYYMNHARQLYGGIVIKNFGTQIKPYTEKNYEPIDYDIQFGITKKLKHAPLRLSVTLQHLENWKLWYENPNSPSNQNAVLDDEEPRERSSFAKKSDEFMRHVIIGTEIILSKNFYIGLGYNYKLRREMAVETRPFMVGTSWGFGFRISKFHFSYARASYHLAGASNLFSLSTNLNEFYKKGK